MIRAKYDFYTFFCLDFSCTRVQNNCFFFLFLSVLIIFFHCVHIFLLGAFEEKKAEFVFSVNKNGVACDLFVRGFIRQTTIQDYKALQKQTKNLSRLQEQHGVVIMEDAASSVNSVIYATLCSRRYFRTGFVTCLISCKTHSNQFRLKKETRANTIHFFRRGYSEVTWQKARKHPSTPVIEALSV